MKATSLRLFVFALLLPISCAHSAANHQSRSEKSLTTQAPLPTPAEIDARLSQEGIVGWVHGAVSGTNMFVLSYRPQGIFRAIEINLIPTSEVIRQQLSGLVRHDKLRVWGKLMLDNPSPQLHLSVTKLVNEGSYDFPGEGNAERSQEELLKLLEGKTSIEAVVHAVKEEGKILVLDYKGFVLPLFMRQRATEASQLSRQDFVRLYFKLQKNPDSPVHLQAVAGPQGKALELLDSIHAQHGQRVSIEGPLLLFPQSPDILFNVFAIKRLEGEFQLERSYTLVNFEDPQKFEAIRKKLQKIWDSADPSGIRNDRNKLINEKIKIRAVGTLNHQDPGQANPQILLVDENSIELLKD